MAANANEGSLLASIDSGVVRQMFGDDVALFKSLLARVLRDFADLALPICVPPDDQTFRFELMGRAHKLRGSAGVIGATAVMRLAGEVEVALDERQPVALVEQVLGRLALALITLREEAAVVLERGTRLEADTDAGGVDRAKLDAADLDELLALLESQNLAALDKFALLSPSLSELVGTVRFNRLREAIDNLEFQVGADLLRQSQSPAAPAVSNTGRP